MNKISPIYLFISFFCLFSCQCVFAGSADGAVNDDDQNNLDERPRKQKRPLRSSIQLKGAGRTRHVLPEICIICRKDRYIVEAHTRKRKKEKLATCSTLDAKNLIQAAKDNSNTTLLLQIEDQDCVALDGGQVSSMLLHRIHKVFDKRNADGDREGPLSVYRGV